MIEGIFLLGPNDPEDLLLLDHQWYRIYRKSKWCSKENSGHLEQRTIHVSRKSSWRDTDHRALNDNASENSHCKEAAFEFVNSYRWTPSAAVYYDMDMVYCGSSLCERAEVDSSELPMSLTSFNCVSLPARTYGSMESPIRPVLQEEEKAHTFIAGWVRLVNWCKPKMDSGCITGTFGNGLQRWWREKDLSNGQSCIWCTWASTIVKRKVAWDENVYNYLGNEK